MNCPKCDHEATKVLESRLSHEGASVRRRRECLKCQHRFTTYEKEEAFVFQIMKRDSSTVPYDRTKAYKSIQIACRKRPVSLYEIEDLLNKVERKIQEDGERTVSSNHLGKLILEGLFSKDKIAYIRFASVYKDFQNIEEFLRELNELSPGNNI
ncbi:MAG: transcriptional repressor NrdR [Oligoflexales bacterium]|nr:transcriptional repressor NrdR [Oligoflexales bacterium]